MVPTERPVSLVETFRPIDMGSKHLVLHPNCFGRKHGNYGVQVEAKFGSRNLRGRFDKITTVKGSYLLGITGTNVCIASFATSVEAAVRIVRYCVINQVENGPYEGFERQA